MRSAFVRPGRLHGHRNSKFHAGASGWIEGRIGSKRMLVWIGKGGIQLTLEQYGHLLADEESDTELALQASRDLSC